MSDRRDFGPIAGQMREALEKYSKEELADLLTHIVRLYVIEADDVVVQEATIPVSSMDNLKTLSFSQLVLNLQMNLDHPELQQLKVSGDRVWVEGRGGSEVVLAGGEDLDSEMPPDSSIIDPAPQRNRPIAVGPVRGPVFPEDEQEVEVRPGTPGQRRREVAATPGVVAEQAGRVARPSVALRDEEAPRAPVAPWNDDPPRGGGRKNTPERPAEDDKDDVTEVSDRFRMLEFD